MTTKHLSLFADTLPLACTDHGHGRPYLLLHGAAGPGAMRGLADTLAVEGRAILPTHPGFAGQSRPEWCRRVDDLALAYLVLLERLELQGVVLVGNSMGGWLAVELALRASPRVAALVLLNAAGLDATPAAGLTDPATIPPAERAAYAFHDPARFASAVPRPTDPAVQTAAQESVRHYGGVPFMQDPSLRQRLPSLAVPTLVLWGGSDRILTPAYGRQITGLIPGAQFELVPQAGHFPQVEQLASVAARIQEFAQ